MNKESIVELYTGDREDKLYKYIRSFYMLGQVQDINLFGIRYEKANRKDEFDDLLGYFDNDGAIYLCDGTTEPGNYYTINPMRKSGAARLAIGFHKNIWGLGKHRNKYDALVQREGSYCLLSRDANKNGKTDINEKPIMTMAGINFHRASLWNKVTKIGKYSAGCIVVQDADDYADIIDTAYESKQDKFSFMLFDGDKL